MTSYAEELQQMVLTPDLRGMMGLRIHSEDGLQMGADLLNAVLPGGNVSIITGFPVLVDGEVRAETDGPLGALSLARYVSARRGSPAVIVDEWCSNVLARWFRVVGYTGEVLWGSTGARRARNADLRVLVEYPGITRNGTYRSMRGEEISHWVDGLDRIAEIVPTVSVGDGGNEAGMGLLPHEEVTASVTNGDLVHSTRKCTALVLASVSNWGAWALVALGGYLAGATDAALAALSPDFLGKAARKLVAAGVVDGVTKRPAMSVDGVAWDAHVSKLKELSTILS